MFQSVKLKKMITASAVPLMFTVIILISIPISQFSSDYLIKEIVTRLVRNSFIVLSLILPIMAGMGINFGMILGAMAGQIGLVFVTAWGMTGLTGILVSALIGAPISIMLGYFCGIVLNRAKGREMITSMMLGFFAIGVYQFLLLFAFGTVIPINNPTIVLSRGYGIRNALSLSVSGALDSLLILRIYGVPIPLITLGVIGVLCVFTVWIKKTKLGQNMRAVGQDGIAADSAGIDVSKTRINAIIISTVLACFGQIIYLQNIGTLNTYNGSDQAALFAAAALIVGGATVNKATVPNAIIGIVLFHLMFIVMPAAGKNLTGQAMLGEYLRMFISFGIVTIALVIHAWKRQKDKDIDRARFRNTNLLAKK